jgi:hypothetical protein
VCVCVTSFTITFKKVISNKDNRKNWPLVEMLMCSGHLSYSNVVITFWLKVGEVGWGARWVAMIIVSGQIQHGGRSQHDRTKLRITCLMWLVLHNQVIPPIFLIFLVHYCSWNSLGNNIFNTIFPRHNLLTWGTMLIPKCLGPVFREHFLHWTHSTWLSVNVKYFS